MKLSLVAVALAAVTVSVHAGPKEDALQVVDRWAKAFAASDVDTIVGLYAPDATFFGTGSKTLVTAPTPVREYFERALLRDRPRGATLLSPVAMELSDSVVLVTGLDTLSGVHDGKAVSNSGRDTFVLQKQSAGWKIVHFHRSAVPG